MKRFTETTKWDDPWFIRLPKTKKLLWLYICDRCDASGVIDFCPELATIQIGGEITEELLTSFGKRVQKLGSGKWQIIKFLPFQYGTVDANCPAHKPVIRLIYSNGLKYPINNLSDRVFNTLKEKDKDKDKDKEEGGTGGKQPAKSQPESEQAVTDYCASLSLPRSDGEYFWNKWIGNGFRNNHEAMRDWKGVIRSWKAAGHCPSQNKKSAVAAKPWERNKPPDLNQEKRDREYEEHRRRQLERKLHEQK